MLAPRSIPRIAVTDWFRNLASIVTRHEPAEDPHALPRAAAALMLELAFTGDWLRLVEVEYDRERGWREVFYRLRSHGDSDGETGEPGAAAPARSPPG